MPPNDSYDDLDVDSKMNGFGIDVDGDHKMILQNMELFMENMMDQGWWNGSNGGTNANGQFDFVGATSKVIWGITHWGRWVLRLDTMGKS